MSTGGTALSSHYFTHSDEGEQFSDNDKNFNKHDLFRRQSSHQGRCLSQWRNSFDDILATTKNVQTLMATSKKSPTTLRKKKSSKNFLSSKFK